MEYPIKKCGKVVGVARVVQEGLYVNIDCRCSQSLEGFCRIKMKGGDKDIDLGTCIREGECFSVRRKIPAKYLGNGEPEFYLVPVYGQRKEKWFELMPEQPCPYISEIKGSRFSVRDGRACIYFYSTESEDVAESQ